MAARGYQWLACCLPVVVGYMSAPSCCYSMLAGCLPAMVGSACLLQLVAASGLRAASPLWSAPFRRHYLLFVVCGLPGRHGRLCFGGDSLARRGLLAVCPLRSARLASPFVAVTGCPGCLSVAVGPRCVTIVGARDVRVVCPWLLAPQSKKSSSTAASRHTSTSNGNRDDAAATANSASAMRARTSRQAQHKQAHNATQHAAGTSIKHATHRSNHSGHTHTHKAQKQTQRGGTARVDEPARKHHNDNSHAAHIRQAADATTQHNPHIIKHNTAQHSHTTQHCHTTQHGTTQHV